MEGDNIFMNPHLPSSDRGQWSSTKILSLVLLTAIGLYLLTEHTVHFFTALPYLLFLACPLMMVFMMRGMNNGPHRR